MQPCRVTSAKATFLFYFDLSLWLLFILNTNTNRTPYDMNHSRLQLHHKISLNWASTWGFSGFFSLTCPLPVSFFILSFFSLFFFIHCCCFCCFLVFTAWLQGSFSVFHIFRFSKNYQVPKKKNKLLYLL